MNATFDELVEKMRQAQEAPDWHPDWPELTALVHNEVPPERKDLILDHLAQCRACADLVLALRSERSGPAAATSPDPRHVLAWEALRQRIEEDDGPTLVDEGDWNASQVTQPSLKTPWWSTVSLAYAVAATLFLVWWAKPFAAKRPGAEAIMTTPQILALAPLENQMITRGAPDPQPEEGTGDLVLVLASTQPHHFSGYKLKILAPSGDRLHERTRLARGPDGAFTLIIPEGALSAGPYRLEVWGADNGTWSKLNTYELMIGEP